LPTHPLQGDSQVARAFEQAFGDLEHAAPVRRFGGAELRLGLAGRGLRQRKEVVVVFQVRTAGGGFIGQRLQPGADL
jgi:hypothetical protein